MQLYKFRVLLIVAIAAMLIHMILMIPTILTYTNNW